MKMDEDDWKELGKFVIFFGSLIGTVYASFLAWG